jgi:hypothetical protein
MCKYPYTGVGVPRRRQLAQWPKAVALGLEGVVVYLSCRAAKANPVRRPAEQKQSYIRGLASLEAWLSSPRLGNAVIRGTGHL